MPTDLEVVFARKRNAQREEQVNITMLSVFVIIFFVVLLLLFVDNSYAQAIGELVDLEEVMELF